MENWFTSLNWEWPIHNIASLNYVHVCILHQNTCICVQAHTHIHTHTEGRFKIHNCFSQNATLCACFSVHLRFLLLALYHSTKLPTYIVQCSSETQFPASLFWIIWAKIVHFCLFFLPMLCVFQVAGLWKINEDTILWCLKVTPAHSLCDLLWPPVMISFMEDISTSVTIHRYGKKCSDVFHSLLQSDAGKVMRGWDFHF